MKTENDYYKVRQIFQERIRKGLIGPGSDNFVKDEEIEFELISNYPLQRYYSGIIYPERNLATNYSDLEEAEIENITENDISDDDDIFENTLKTETNLANESANENQVTDNNFKKPEREDIFNISHNNFFPTNIGLTFCVPNDVKEIDVEFSFGTYDKLDDKEERKILISKNSFDEIVESPSFPFKELLKYENGYMILSRNLKGKAKSPRTGEFAEYDAFKNTDEFKNNPIYFHVQYFEKLIGQLWKRTPININERIKIEDTAEPIIIFEKKLTKTTDTKLKVGYAIKTYKIKNDSTKTYVKILLVNLSTKQSPNRFSNRSESLNRKSLFQAEIKVISDKFVPYKSYTEQPPFDSEAEVLNYIYKDVKNYAIGHNCAVIWDSNNHPPKFIKTTFLPQYDIKDLKNQFEESDFDDSDELDIINQSRDIYNLSHFSNLSKEQIIQNLENFVEVYGNWINGQKEKVKKPPTGPEKIIINNLEHNYERLRSNIQQLNDDTIFRAFQLANTAMLLQIIVSNDPDFAGKEKEISELNKNVKYDELSFFEDYDFTRLPFGRPKYRPFQLAFILLKLNIKNSDVDNETGKEIVDLIWFPTGGGKTEAYLAVAAFTILYRRLSNSSGYEGTSVIMRYTLRLLTAQQFERASRLISALEFIRSNFPEELKDEPITIGMWVGMSSTPNKINDATAKVEKIGQECNRLNNNQTGNPKKFNVFQISSCPWCGTKIISENEHGNCIHGFSINGRGRNQEFKIKCINKSCRFHNEIPVQVVDEMLYKKPPTLLFGTVDKFAMLAWEANGHKFFNSLDTDGEKLPPDLIIQDELHLLSGPLGSITGIFESVIDILCTKKLPNGKVKKPTIIASTATTRNTNEQIKALYGRDKKVNIFPPTGLSYKDSFFAKVSKKESKRRYIGIIPTGKTALDTQLQILANLLVARIEVYKELIENKKNDFEIFDKYWTLVSYYNSLKDVGKIYNKVGDEILNFTATLQLRLFGNNPNLAFNYLYLNNRIVELTSRIESVNIKKTLKDLEEKTFNETTIVKQENKKPYVQNVIDLVLATNMISVGIDIDRFNIMLMNGQPKNIAEYIQASSRVGRGNKGLVVALLDANRARDKSHFEHFIPFHQAFYKYVEPISITPFTENTINKMLASMIVAYVRHKFSIMNANNAARHFESNMLEGLKNEIRQRYGNERMYLIFEKQLNELTEKWIDKVNNYNLLCYKGIQRGRNHCIGLISPPSEKKGNWIVMQSMREIDTESYIEINIPK